jgi:DNA-binding response OmpR family regulator
MAMLMRSEGFDTIELADGIEALSYLAASEIYRTDLTMPDLIVADINMPTFSGLDLLMGIRESRVRPPVMLVTGERDEEVCR